MAVAGMVLGIIALVLSWFPFLGWILGLLGVIFGGLGIGKANKVGRGKGAAIAGLICGLLAIIIGIVIFVLAMRVAKESLEYHKY